MRSALVTLGSYAAYAAMNDRFHALILATEHTEVAQMNMRLALERRAESEQVMPGIRLVVG